MLKKNCTYIHKIGEQKYAHLNRDVKNGAQEKMDQSCIYGFLGKRGLFVYLAALKKGAIWAAHPYHGIYRELNPPSQNHTYSYNLYSKTYPIGIIYITKMGSRK